MAILLLREFITKGGAKIKGDMPINSNDDVTASKLTTDDKQNQMQGLSRYNNYGRWKYMSDKKPNLTKKKNKKSLKKRVEEGSAKKMDELIEDIFTKKDFDRDFVTKQPDLRLNGIQNLDTIKDSNPILIRKVETLRDLIGKNDATGEEKAIIINYLLDMDMTDIPVEYKNELKKKIR